MTTRSIVPQVLALTFSLLAAPVATIAAAADSSSVRPRIDSRFSADELTEEPDFRQHVVPLLGQLGCNGRACHGSFQGQGGFRLSLFGYDFKSDHENLLGGDEPRTNLEKPLESLILQKPLEEIPHDGGQRLTKGTWQYRVLRKWIEDGAKGMPEDAVSFVRLDVTPSEILAKKEGDSWQLKAVAVWSDGSREDVTPLCRFQSNNDDVVRIDDTGYVTANGPGDTHVVTFYDNGVVPVPVIFPVSDKVGPNFPEVSTPTKIDELVLQKLRKLGEVPAGRCTDTEFLRRVSIDMTGTLPTAEEVEAFLADTSADKRARKIDELLERPGYASWWATKFCDWTGNNSQVNQNQGPDRRDIVSRNWYSWMRKRIADNMPYDELMTNIVLGESRLEDESFEDYCKRMSGYLDKDSEAEFSEHPTLPYFWSRSNFRTPEERALGFAYTFLGVRIQCAQCHKHPFDQWTKDDFDRFKNFFTRVKFGAAPGTKDAYAAILAALEIDTEKLKGNQLDGELQKLGSKGKVVPFRETYVVAPEKKVATKTEKGKRERVVAGRTATVLGGDEFKIDEMEDPREVLMDWMRDEENPYFARAIVNRVWASYFNVGIVEPPDDLSLANPPSNEPLLAHLEEGFREHGYDLKWLHREIANSDTYQRSWETNATNELDERNFARAVPRRIPAEVIYDGIRIATGGDEEATALQSSMKGRSIAEPVVSPRGGNYALTVFGRSIRESNCDCDRSMEPSLLQTVFLKNDREVIEMISRKGGFVDQVVRREQALSKPAEDTIVSERKQAEKILDRAKDRLKKAKGSRKEDAIKEAEEALAAAEKNAAEKRKLVEEHEAQAKAALVDAERERVDVIIRRAYLRTVGRPPEAEELAASKKYFAESGDIGVATRDLMWALLNTKEFSLNH